MNSVKNDVDFAKKCGAEIPLDEVTRAHLETATKEAARKEVEPPKRGDPDILRYLALQNLDLGKSRGPRGAS